METEIEKIERIKAAKKAVPGGRPKFKNLIKNWLHQGFTYMDRGEQGFKLFTEILEFLLVGIVLNMLLRNQTTIVLILLYSFIIVHTFNWITNNLFWSVIMFSFPGIKNPGPVKTNDYLNSMSKRLKTSRCISGMLIYGSMTRGKWHNRSDIDMRLLRKNGVMNFLYAGLVMMRERFIAFIYMQPIDIFLADDIDFLLKMRNDESPIFLIKNDVRLENQFPDVRERNLSIKDFEGHDMSSSSNK